MVTVTSPRQNRSGATEPSLKGGPRRRCPWPLRSRARSGFSLLELLLAAALGLLLAGLLLAALPAWLQRGARARREVTEEARVTRALDLLARDLAAIDPTRPPSGPEALSVGGEDSWEWWVRPSCGGPAVLVRHRLQPGADRPRDARGGISSLDSGGEWVREEWSAVGASAPDPEDLDVAPARVEVLLAGVVRLVRHPSRTPSGEQCPRNPAPAALARAVELTTLPVDDSRGDSEGVRRRCLSVWP